MLYRSPCFIPSCCGLKVCQVLKSCSKPVDPSARWRCCPNENLLGFLIKSEDFSLCVLQYLPSTAVSTTLQLQELRYQMHLMSISAYIIPGTDAHLSEYLAPRDARVAFMTGFTGSAGTAVVTQSKAALWTDSRYWVQAERQMDCNWELEKDGGGDHIWLISEVPSGGEIGFDPFLFSLSESQVVPLNTRCTYQ
uniref:X-prolyl aminopeptidase (aminopeptidase P) 2, membrane-bound n=1 Tax=Amphiprion percula TaxID=161767 RepID=A0A3P8S8P4_AMPPE